MIQDMFDTAIRNQTKNNINKKWALIQTTCGKYDPNIVFMQKSINGAPVFTPWFLVGVRVTRSLVSCV